MNKEHWVLTALWLVYCILHSVLADAGVKDFIQRIMGYSFKFYRPVYSVFALLTLVFILWFQFSVQSILLFRQVIYLNVAAVIAGLAGAGVMIKCITVYFYELSGLQAIQHANAKNTLQQSGLHKYVRHPLYTGTLLFVWSLFLLFPLLSNFIAVVIITLYVLLGIKLEEKKLVLEYGKAYREYAKKVPMLLPGWRW